jgi:hypothetical protein
VDVATDSSTSGMAVAWDVARVECPAWPAAEVLSSGRAESTVMGPASSSITGSAVVFASDAATPSSDVIVVSGREAAAAGGVTGSGDHDRDGFSDSAHHDVDGALAPGGGTGTAFSGGGHGEEERGSKSSDEPGGVGGRGDEGGGSPLGDGELAAGDGDSVCSGLDCECNADAPIGFDRPSSTVLSLTSAVTGADSCGSSRRNSSSTMRVRVETQMKSLVKRIASRALPIFKTVSRPSLLQSASDGRDETWHRSRYAGFSHSRTMYSLARTILSTDEVVS